MTAPERIWIRQPILDGYDIKPAQIALSQIHDDATGYTRTDIHQAALDRIAELEGAIRDVTQGNVMDRVTSHHRDGTLSKLDRCRHGQTHSAGCENCDAEYLSAVLAKGDG